MKLSEAIRLGGMATGQAFSRMWNDNGDTCAMGGAFECVGLLDRMKLIYEETKNCAPSEQRARNKELIAGSDVASWIQVLETPTTCPVCGKREEHLIVPHLNDTHRWTRERIADWVETIENAQVAVVEKGMEHVTP